jgi:drug/metabolite transporter (DMT)-like permease
MSNTSLGLLAAILTVFSWTIGTFSFAHASRIANPASVNRVRLLYAFVVLGIMTCIISAMSPIQLFSLPEESHYLWFGLSGIIGLTLGDYFAFTAYHILGSRRTSLFSSFAPGAALFAGMFFVDEQLSFLGIIGMFISIIGVLLLSLSKNEQAAVEAEGRGTDERVCTDHICLNGAKCFPSVKFYGYYCQCNFAFYGPYCEHCN